jgi:hypothetical protein
MPDPMTVKVTVRVCGAVAWFLQIKGFRDSLTFEWE